ncbi:WSC domain-containing protein [Fusarium keratoplasticum]|uniref:WSC domain-containing protein n=1 Tax=Fusarium keratoplasticum TaxID=1328300 RepID=A0ACC0RFL9_9HYPO|nr:WSC domain-containing protein [Fusarium keratoplasticum]KAI8684143.1 WSC domain-containing protein [Fusarium keratoplasticum]KAI8688256.1 WSC domain-containing protein [Fusarium keratoplasticum]
MSRLSPFIIAVLFLLIGRVTSLTIRDSGSQDPKIYRESNKYKYYGCYNETTDIKDSAEERALTGGTHLVKAGKMTVPMCLEFCTFNGTEYAFAGLEWSRECWCAPYLSALSEKLHDDNCTNPCEGNSSQVCGGPLKLSIYELSKGGDAPDSAAITRTPWPLLLTAVLAAWFL